MVEKQHSHHFECNLLCRVQVFFHQIFDNPQLRDHCNDFNRFFVGIKARYVRFDAHARIWKICWISWISIPKSDPIERIPFSKKNYHHNFQNDLLIWCLREFFIHSVILTKIPIYIFIIFFLHYVSIGELSFLFTISKSVVIMFKRFIVIFRVVSFDINIDDRDVRPKLMGEIGCYASRIAQLEKNEQ